MLVAQFDTAVVNLAGEAIGRSFAAGIDALQWILDGYNLVYAALLLTGGLLADRYGRRRTFLVAIPAGVAAVGLAPLAVPESRDPQGRHFDALAQVLGSFALAAFAAAAAALPPFIAVERSKAGAALVPLALFRSRGFRAAVLATAGMTFGTYGTLFLLPREWQDSGTLAAMLAGGLVQLGCAGLAWLATRPTAARGSVD